MDAREYIEQLKAFTDDYVDWWCKPYEKFYEEYDKRNRSFIARLVPIRIDTQESISKLNDATLKFKDSMRQKSDLIGEIYTFLDDNYETYLLATDTQRDAIRTVIGNTFYKPKVGVTNDIGNYMAALLFEYVKEHVVTELKTKIEEAWLTRGLVAISMEDCSVDFRDTITCMAELYVAAKRNGLDPETDFQRVGKISSKKTPKGGESSVSSMMAAIGEYAATNYAGLFR